jgi:ATP-dependent helicase HrpA
MPDSAIIPPQPVTGSELHARIAGVMLRDQRRLISHLGRGEIEHELVAAEQRLAARRAAVPAISYPANLPIAERRDDLLNAIRDHQVVIVAGETGSGKSTQLPKLCLELGRGVLGLIGHTQPRRLAARTIAERIAEELGTELGATVGYTVRFTDRAGESTLIKVMTDGILLAELQRDRMLSRYDTLIIDEAHERSLNIDFLLGYLKRLLPQRPDLKLIVTSATIDTARFSHHFGDAPVIEVTGRTYPVEVRYRPIGVEATDDRDQVQAVCEAVDELAAEGPGDILVFLSGEREIHDTADALRRLKRANLEVLALYARLSAVEQHRIFQPHTSRRVVLSTNVAETSLTVPGVRYVIDAGAVRMSRYSHRLKVQRLPIEPISQASANQRAGRCGRVAPGICIRLYGEDDFAARQPFTEPEILRTNLASVILQMTNIGLGDIAAFPFVDVPDQRAIRDGVALLDELGALSPADSGDQRRLTSLGRRLAQLPIDPRLGRMVIEAERHGCVREVLVIASALSIQDPRERPADKRQAADEVHRRFTVEHSDFLSFVKLWDYLRERQQALTSSQFRTLCRAEFLNYLRVREWQDLYSQLRQVSGGLGIRSGSTAGHPDHIHQALMAGLLSHLGMRDGDRREYRGARNAKFAIVAGSALASKPPKWVMAAELVETNRLWGRVGAAVQPEWAERIGAHLVKRSYGEPYWDARRGSALITERVTLYGLPIVAGRQIGYDRVDPPGARQMFIRHALIDGEWMTGHRFVESNRHFVEQAKALIARSRRADFVNDEAVFLFYDRQIPTAVVSARHFDSWWKRAGVDQPALLDLTADALGVNVALDPADYPDVWHYDDLALPVTYRFEPGDPTDGVTVHIPLPVLNRITGTGFDWHVPGFRRELVTALTWTLPKASRRALLPIAETIARVYDGLDPAAGRLDQSLAAALGTIAGEPIAATDFDITRVARHLRLTFSIEDDTGRPVASGTDLGALRTLLSGRLRAAIADTATGVERVGITAWDFGDLPQIVESRPHGNLVRGYPALIDDGGSVSIRVFTNPEIQQRIMRSGTRRLLLLTVPVARKALEHEIGNPERLAITSQLNLTLGELIDDCVIAAVDHLVARHGGPSWAADGFHALQTAAQAELFMTTRSALATAAAIAVAAAAVQARLDRLVAPIVRPSVADAKAQLGRLVRPGFVTATGLGHLPDVPRYVSGIARRLDKLVEQPGLDQQRMVQVRSVEQRYEHLLGRLPRGPVASEVIELGWTLEELRVSLFANALGTSGPVSTQRITRRLDELERALGGIRGSGPHSSR